MKLAVDDCVCLTPPFATSAFASRAVGVDRSEGRFGEVTIETCLQCGRNWLRYFVEYEAFPESGRWYRGLLPAERAGAVTPGSAVAILEALDWYFYGGSYFRTTGKIGSGPLFTGL